MERPSQRRLEKTPGTCCLLPDILRGMILKFRDFQLDSRQCILLRGGEPVSMEPQVFDLLALFVGRAGQLVHRDEMIAEVWGGRIVSEAAISSRIAAVRKAIGDDGRRQELLQTVQRRGFRFIAEVENVETAPQGPDAGAEQQIRIAHSRDGTGIAYAVSGSGPPLMRAGHFLTHLELDWSSPIWRPMLDRLGQSFTLTRYDQRSTGLSDPNPPSLELDRLCDDLEAVADAVGLERFPIFAASQGVPVSIAFAVRNPHRVSGLVLYGGYAQGRSVRSSEEENRTAEAILTIIRNGWGQSGGAFARAFATTYMPDATKEQLDGMAEMQLRSATAENAAALRAAIDRFDITSLLRSVHAPTLVLHVSEDAVHPVSQGRLLAAEIPNARLHVMEGRNHVPVPHDPCWEEILSVTVRFLRETA
jgi:DNA-binding winged helix-turn-helix (wHTH) protein